MSAGDALAFAFQLNEAGRFGLHRPSVPAAMERNPAFDYVELERVPPMLLCASICNEPLVNPVVHACGNTFCRVCIDNYMRVHSGTPGSGQSECPTCKEPISAANLEALKRPRDALIINQLDSLLVRTCVAEGGRQATARAASRNAMQCVCRCGAPTRRWAARGRARGPRRAATPPRPVCACHARSAAPGARRRARTTP